MLWEMYTGNPLFPGSSRLDMLHCINSVIDLPCIRNTSLGSCALDAAVQLPPGGTTPLIVDGMPAEFAELLCCCLHEDPDQRASAAELLTLPCASLLTSYSGLPEPHRAISALVRVADGACSRARTWM